MRDSGGVHLRLGRLDEGAVGELVRALRPDDADPAVVHRFWETTEGVPLMLVEFLRATDADAVMPAGVRDALRSRLEPVSETGRQVLAAAAVLGRSFDVGAVRSVSGRTEEEAVVSVEEVVDRGLVRERTTDYDFDHELLRTGGVRGDQPGASPAPAPACRGRGWPVPRDDGAAPPARRS